MKLFLLVALPFLPLARGCYSHDDVKLEVVHHMPFHDFRYISIDRFNMKTAVSWADAELRKHFDEYSSTVIGYQDYSVEPSHNACYRHYNPMDVEGAFEKALDGLANDPYQYQSLSTPSYESSLTALALSATRPQDNHFSSTKITSDGRRIVKLLILMAGVRPYQRGQASEVMGRPAFPIDGTADCTCNAPTMQQVANILEAKDLYLVVVTDPESIDWWKAQGPRWFGNRVTFIDSPALYTPYTLEIVSAVERILCNVESTTAAPTPFPQPEPLPTPLKCYKADEVQLQLALHQPIYGWHLIWKDQLSKTLSDYSTAIKHHYPGAQYTLVGYQDYGYAVDVLREGCWYAASALTQAGAYDKAVEEALKARTAAGSLVDPNYQSSTHALALSAIRPEVGFSSNDTSSEGKPYLKVLALVTTLRPYYSGQNDPRATPFDEVRGEGKCNMDAPTLEQLQDIIVGRDMRLVVLASGGGFDWWSLEGKALFGSRLAIRKVANDYQIGASILTDAIEEVSCPAVPTVSPTPTVVPTSAEATSTKKRPYCRTKPKRLQ